MSPMKRRPPPSRDPPCARHGPLHSCVRCAPDGWPGTEFLTEANLWNRAAARVSGTLPLVPLHAFMSAGDESERPQWLVRGLLRAGGTSLLVGNPKCGKSTVVRQLTLNVASGHGSWLGREMTAAGPVLYVTLDESRWTVHEHYAKLLSHLPDHVRGHAEASIRLLDFAGTPIPVEPSERNAILADTVQAIDPELVVVDTLARWCLSEDTSDYGGMIRDLDPFIAIARQFDTHVMLLHHARKSGGSHGVESMGSAAVVGSVDAYISIQRGENGDRTIYAEGRDNVNLLPGDLRLDDSGIAQYEARTQPAQLSALDARRKARVLRDEGCSFGAIADELGMSKSTIHGWLR